MSEFLTLASDYAGRGIPVVPLHAPSPRGGCTCGKPACASPAKHPRTIHGLKDATTDLATLASWDDRWSNLNIGGCTGVVFDVFDLDGQEGIDNFLDYCQEHDVDVTVFPRVETGRGRHVYVASTGRGNRARILPGVDFRGAGGYVVMPGSKHILGMTYGWKAPLNGHLPECPPALLALLDDGSDPDTTEPVDPAPIRAVGGTSRWGRRALEDEMRLLSTAPEGRRNDELNHRAFRIFQAVAGGEIDGGEAEGHLRAVAVGIGLSEIEVDKTVASARTAGLARPRGPRGECAPTAAPTAATEAPQELKRGICMADVTIEPVRWLWPGRVPFGKVTIIDGNPGLGKSAMHMDIAARVSRGREMPDGTPTERGAVVMMCAEDGIGDTLRPRLEAAGADLTRIEALGEDDMPLIPDDLERIERIIVESKAVLLIVDPLYAFVNARSAKSISDQEMRQQAMTPLTQLAKRTGVAIVLVRHLSKTQGASAIMAGAGSMGIIGAARSAFLVGLDPDDPEVRVLACIKANLARKPPSLSWRLRAHPDVDAPYVEWLGITEVDADGLVAKPPSDEERGALAEAKTWLAAFLDDHALHPAAEVQAAARKEQIAVRTLRRAAHSLKVDIRRVATGWTWQLPWPAAEPEEKGGPGF